MAPVFDVSVVRQTGHYKKSNIFVDTYVNYAIMHETGTQTNPTNQSNKSVEQASPTNQSNKPIPSMKLMKLPFNKMLALGVASLLSVSAAHAQSYLIELNDGTSVGAYTLSGTAINSTMITGLSNPQFFTTIGNDLYIAEGGSNNPSQIGEYTLGTGVNAGTATLVADPFIAGLNNAYGIATDGTNLFVANGFADTVTEFNATTGAPVGTAPFASLPGLLAVGDVVAGGNLYVAGLNLGGGGQILEYNTSTGALVTSWAAANGNPFGITSNGTDLFVTSQQNNNVSEYTLAGVQVGSGPLVTGLPADAQGLTVSGTNLYVTSWGANQINVYSTVTGLLVGTNPLITGPDGHIVDVAVVPEPSTWAMLLGGLGLLAFCVRMRRTQV
jgi:hypothetical protein